MTRGTEDTGNIERQESQGRKEKQVIEKRQERQERQRRQERQKNFFCKPILQMLLYGESGRPFKHFIVVLLKSREITLSFKG